MGGQHGAPIERHNVVDTNFDTILVQQTATVGYAKTDKTA
jgi:hypothetical protein